MYNRCCVSWFKVGEVEGGNQANFWAWQHIKAGGGEMAVCRQQEVTHTSATLMCGLCTAELVKGDAQKDVPPLIGLTIRLEAILCPALPLWHSCDAAVYRCTSRSVLSSRCCAHCHTAHTRNTVAAARLTRVRIAHLL
jgi:hypothetical protein